MKRLFPLLLLAVVAACNHKNETSRSLALETGTLIVTPVTPNTFTHTSYLQTQDFGNVECNGMIVTDNKEAIIFDTPTNDSVSNRLISWLTDSLGYTIKAVVATHFHNDCLGGLNAFHQHKIPSYANTATITLAVRDSLTVPQHAINDSISLKVGNTSVQARYFGKGHTHDNIVGYYPGEKVLFGGCLIKELDATKGYLGDADTTAWSNTVRLIKQAYPEVKKVIPGHGITGDVSLLDYTIQLFEPKK